MKIVLKLAITGALIGLMIILLSSLVGIFTVGTATLQAIAIGGLVVGTVLMGLCGMLAVLWIIVEVWADY